MSRYPMYFDDTKLDLVDVVAQLRLWKRKHGIKLVIIDYLQLMSYSGLAKHGNREQEISTITRQLKRAAKELDIPILLLSQLSREVEKRADKRPVLSDLRESGAIEQDADIVCFIYRPEYYQIEPNDEMQALGANTEFIIAKYRNGSIDRVGLYFDENKTKFMDPEDYAESVAADAKLIQEAEGNRLPMDNSVKPVSPADAFGPPAPQKGDDSGVPF